MKKLFVIILMMFVLFLPGCKINENMENGLSGNTDSQQEIFNSGENNVNETKKLDSEIAESYIDIINSMEAEIFNEGFKYDLIYFNNDDVPELVVDLPNYWLTIYTFKNGKTVNMAENDGMFTYGTGGLVGYSYASKKGVMTSSSHDNEKYGYTLYYEVNENGVIINSYTIQTIIFTEDERENGKQTEIGKLLYTNLDKCNFELLVGIKNSAEIIAEIKGKSVENIEKEYTSALEIGNERYKEATNFYTGGLDYENETVPVGDYRGYKITNINEVKELFTNEKFDKYVGRTQDDSDNFNSIVEENGEFYRLDADRGGDIFYIKTVLMPNIIDENKMIFNAISYSLSEIGEKKMTQEKWNLMETSPDEFLKSVYSSDINIENDKFVLTNENGTWKVDEFVLPF